MEKVHGVWPTLGSTTAKEQNTTRLHGRVHGLYVYTAVYTTVHAICTTARSPLGAPLSC